MKIVIFLCDRYEAQRSRTASRKRGFDRLDEPFTINRRGRVHNAHVRTIAIVKCWWRNTTRDIVRSNGIVGMLGCTGGVCIELA